MSGLWNCRSKAPPQRIGRPLGQRVRADVAQARRGVGRRESLHRRGSRARAASPSRRVEAVHHAVGHFPERRQARGLDDMPKAGAVVELAPSRSMTTVLG